MKRLNIFSTNELDYSDKYYKAEGHYLDNKYDLNAGSGTNVLGYANPDILEAIHENINSCTSSFWRLRHPIWDVLGDKLDIISNNKFKSYIPALSGTDSVDNSLKLMWWYYKNQGEKRNTILIRENSYHSGSITGWQMVQKQEFTTHFPQINFVTFFDDLETTVKEVGEENIAGVLIDTVPWINGLSSNSLDYWTNFQKTIDKYNLLLCVDEVLTGIGRMGVWLHHQEFGLKPNLVTLGKALSAGHANLTLTLLDNKITEGIKYEWLAIGNTRSANTLGAVVVNATLDYMLKNNTLTYINDKIIPHVQRIKKSFEACGITEEVFLEGSMLKINIDNIEYLEQSLDYNGLYHNLPNFFWYFPFYNATEEELSFVEDRVVKALTYI